MIFNLTKNKEIQAQVETVGNSLRQQRLILLVGAGISSPPPANLPLAGQLCDGLWQLLNEKMPPSINAMQALAKIEMRPEEFLALIYRGLGDRLYGFFDGMGFAQPNAYHYFIVSLAKQGLLREVWTTNFDCLIERACQEIGLPYKVRCSDEKNKSWTQDDRELLIFKMHGTLRDQTGNPLYGSLQFNSYQVDRPFSREINQYIRESLQENDLLVLGYSGQDPYDILPCLHQPMMLSDLFWLLHTATKDSFILDPGSPRAEGFGHIAGWISDRVRGRGIVINTADFLKLLGKSVQVPFQESRRQIGANVFWDHGRRWADGLPVPYIVLAVGIVMWNQATNYRGHESFRLAQEIMKFANEMASSGSDESFTTTVRLWMAMVQEIVNKAWATQGAGTVEQHYRDALDLAQTNQLYDLEAEITSELATFLMDQNRPAEANQLLETGFDKVQRRGNRFWIGRYLIGLGLATEDPAQAVTFLQRVLDEDFPLGFTARLNVLEHLVQQYERLRDIPQLVTTALNYLCQKVLVHGKESKYTPASLEIMGRLATYSLVPSARPDWHEIERSLSTVGLRQLWLDWLKQMVPAAVTDWYKNTDLPFSEIEFAFGFVRNLAEFSYLDFTEPISRLILFCATQAPDALDDWLSQERVRNANEPLLKGFVIAFFQIPHPSDYLQMVYGKLATSNNLPILGAIAYSIEELSLKEKQKALSLVISLLESGNGRAKETAISSLESLAKVRDQDAWRILDLAKDDPYPPVSIVAKRYLQNYRKR